ncbi:hypothetical protein DMN91_008664, partial [Ooceraea biroi]
KWNSFDGRETFCAVKSNLCSVSETCKLRLVRTHLRCSRRSALRRLLIFWLNFRERNDFRNWRQQLELLQDTYHLDSNAVKILISLRLRGKALRWFHSRPGHLEMSAKELVNAMSGMFDHRPNKLALRKEFENRLWRKDESFCDYVFEKTTLANRITVDPEELINLMIDGIPDTRLRDQARMNRYERVEDLLDAFKKITLYEQPRSDRDHRTVKKPSSVKPTAGADATRPKEAHCFNCNEVGHAKRDCTKPQREWGSCYRCGSLEHHSRNCTQSHPTTSTVPTQGTSRSTETSTHLIQPTRPE